MNERALSEELSQELLIVEAPFDTLEKIAANLKVKKETKEGVLADYTPASKSAFRNVEGRDFFQPFEQQHMLGTLLNSLKVRV